MSQPQFNPQDFISDKPVTAAEKEILNKAVNRTKAQLFFEKNSGFIASLVSTMDFIWDRSIPTACTNGVFLAWNPEFYLSLSEPSRVTVLAHEAWHVAYQHMLRLAGRDPKLWNHAADYVINGMLEEAKYFMGGFPYLLDPAYQGMNTDEVYGILDKNREQSLKINNPLDGDFQVPGAGDPNSKMNGGMTQDQIKAKAQSNVIKAAQMAKMGGQMAGSIPGEVQMAIDEFLSPKLPWQQILANFFEAMTSMAYSFRRPNRRYTDPILPGRIGMDGLNHLMYFLDISGSVTDGDIVRFNSEVKHIKDTYSPEKVTLVTFDTQIRDVYVFEEDDEFEKIVVTGRGGTDLVPVFAYAEEHQPQAMIIFTDLYVRIPEEEPKCPVIWICCGHPTAQVPYGKLIHIDTTDDAP